MRNKTKCWDIIQKNLLAISENRVGALTPDAALAIAVIVSAGRTNDTKFINSDAITHFSYLATIDSYTTKKLLLKTLAYLDNTIDANFNLDDDIYGVGL